MVAISENLAIILLCCATFVLSIDGGIRKSLGNVNDVQFIVPFTFLRGLFSLLIWAGVGAPTQSVNSVVWENIAYMIASGVASMFGIFLFFGAVRRISVSSVCCMIGIAQLTFGITTDYFIAPSGINGVYLASACCLNAVGLLLLVYYDSIKPALDIPKEDTNGEASSLLTRNHQQENENQDENQDRNSHFQERHSENSHDNDGDRDGNNSAMQGFRQLVCGLDMEWLSWIFRSTLVGILFTLYSIFPALVSVSSDPITDGAILNLAYNCGVVLALPLAIYLFCHVQIVGSLGEKINSFDQITSSLCKLTIYELFIISLIAALVTGAFACYFYAIEVIPDAISFTILCCQPVVAALASLFIFKDVQSIDFNFSLVILTAAALCYSISMYVLVVYAIE